MSTYVNTTIDITTIYNTTTSSPFRYVWKFSSLQVKIKYALHAKALGETIRYYKSVAVIHVSKGPCDDLLLESLMAVV